MISAVMLRAMGKVHGAQSGVVGADKLGDVSEYDVVG